MAALSLKSIFIWVSNILIPFVLWLNMQNTTKDQIRAKVDLFTSNAKILYFLLLAMWIGFNLLMLWTKYQKEQEVLKKKIIDRKISEIELKRLEDEKD
jgi:cell division protein FtsL